MKRTSLIIALLVLVPAASQARHSERYRIRYSPYAFSYHNSGLIPGSVKYSPYAFTPSSSGLVYDGTRYTPYAFTYRNPGLVVDYYWWQAPVCPPCEIAPHHSRVYTSSRRPVARRTAPRKHAISAAKLRQIRETDGMHVIHQALKDRGFENVEVNYRVSFQNRTASAVFILRQQGLVIKYSNPEVVASMEAESPARQVAAKQYEERWQALAKTFQGNGSAIYCVNTAEKDQMVAALDNCAELIPERGEPATTTLYAKN